MFFIVYVICFFEVRVEGKFYIETFENNKVTGKSSIEFYI